MKVAVLGAGGVVGQWMMCSVPLGVEPVFTRRTGGRLFEELDLTDPAQTYEFLERHRPEVIVNLAGENSVDVVEQNPQDYVAINLDSPARLAAWCFANSVRMVHVSSQAVFSGEEPPYGPYSPTEPVNAYGQQKLAAEQAVVEEGRAFATVARLTFVVGARPFPAIGRRNPIETMIQPDVIGGNDQTQLQVNDRFFSPAVAPDAARQLWELVGRWVAPVVHIGVPVRVSRYDLACQLSVDVKPIPHDVFKGIAPRPRDTTFGPEAVGGASLSDGLRWAVGVMTDRRSRTTLHRARELAVFLGLPVSQVVGRLERGFLGLHADVAADFNLAEPKTDEELLEWYRNTEAYIWELSAYHLDAGFNYSGMCEGIAVHLKAQEKWRVLALGDGIGDLTLTLADHGLDPVYHDLAGSRTAEFALTRFELNRKQPISHVLTSSWEPPIHGEVDAIVALDFFEHLVNVEEWAKRCAEKLRPGGLLLAQNAFAIGDNEHGGSIPMHLTRNNRFENDWDPLLRSLGLEPEPGGWWRKP